MTDLIGHNLGPYRIVATLGEDGLTRVYKAFQPGLERVVVIKVLHEYLLRDRRFLARFQHEAHLITHLDHPHILPVYDFGQEGQIAYLVMRYVEGNTLREAQRSTLSLDRVGKWLDQVAAALDYAHQQGILHRDLKPSSILLEGNQHILLSDFGLAQMVSSESSTPMLSVGSSTPAYMSPEQAEGRPLDGRSDIYALGVILYELITGRVPFRAETPLAIAIKHLSAPLPLPRLLNPTIPDKVEQVILKALAKSPEDRYSSAEALMEAFHQAIATARMPVAIRSMLPVATGPVCPTCHYFNRPGMHFCEYCATPLQEGWAVCNLCRYTNRLGVKFCEQCASVLTISGPICPRCRFRNRVGVNFCEQCATALEQTLKMEI